jgi:formylglycine-generating enzyme required for sulfatase activity
MHGNVLEWCLNECGNGRASRGGSWFNAAEYCRSGFRGWNDPGDRGSGLGFRPAAVPIGGGQITVYGGLGQSKEGSFTSSIGLKMLKVPGKDYYMGETEVTQEQWQKVMGNNPSEFKGNNLPVEQVSWDDAMEFCRRLTERERAAGKLPRGYEYTLPTEEQWEYACRAGTTGDYAGPLDQMAWYEASSGWQTHPVGTKRANAWGFYDMHGNVWEWCLNEYENGRASRGGSWFDAAEYCRSGYRYWLGPGPGIRNYFLGFRPAAVPAR